MSYARKVGMALVIASQVIVTAGVSEQVQILSRREWKAEPAKEKRDPPIQTGKFPDKEVKAENVLTPRSSTMFLTVHHRGVKGDPNNPIEKKLQRLQTFSWGPDYWIGRTQIFLGDMPYHFYISYLGEVAEGRELKWSAWSNTEYKKPDDVPPSIAITLHITVVLEGNFQEEEPTPEQIGALEELLYRLATEHKIPLANILYHAQVVDPGKTTCPGHNMIRKMPNVLAALKKRGLQ